MTPLVKIDNKYADLPEWVEDIQIIKQFLIQNIDSAFVQWKKGAWARHLDFEQFCEYLPPYKAEELQPLDAWRTYLREFHRLEQITVLRPTEKSVGRWPLL